MPGTEEDPLPGYEDVDLGQWAFSAEGFEDLQFVEKGRGPMAEHLTGSLAVVAFQSWVRVAGSGALRVNRAFA